MEQLLDMDWTLGSCTNVRKKPRLKRANLRRHELQCTICSHPLRPQIEAIFLGAIRQDRGYFQQKYRELGVSRYSIYRHAHATGLVKARNIESKKLIRQFTLKIGRNKTKDFQG